MPLQLQLLGCDTVARAADGKGGIPGCQSGDGNRPAAQRNTGLQELDFQCTDCLSDDELAAAAAALPDLRQLSIVAGTKRWQCVLHGLSGAVLAAYTACRRLRDITLPYSADLDVQQVVAQLMRLTSLTSIYFRRTIRTNSGTVAELQAALQAEPRMAAISKCT